MSAMRYQSYYGAMMGSMVYSVTAAWVHTLLWSCDLRPIIELSLSLDCKMRLIITLTLQGIRKPR